MVKLKIAITINYLAIGGTQTFALSLARGLSDLGHDVFVYDFNLPVYTQTLKALKSPLLDSDLFTLAEFPIKIPMRIYKRLINLKWPEIILTWILNKKRIIHFKNFIETKKIDVVSSHLMAADTLSSYAIANKPEIIHCITMHGSYEGFPKASLKKKREKVFERVNGIVYLTDKNIKFLDLLKNKNKNLKYRQIYNGYLSDLFKGTPSITRQLLKIPSAAFVFIQVARGTIDKGWEETIKAFFIIKAQLTTPVYLILVGDGEYLGSQRAKYAKFPEVIFYGYSGNPLPLIQLSDIGLLPTYYAGESLPNTIIEYIFSEKPILTSDIGEIKKMIGGNSEYPCGFALDIKEDGRVKEKDLAAKMLDYIQDSELYQVHVQNTIVQKQKFLLDNCASAYIDFFLELKKLN
jgi:glycosyltransferase involved in cell wall biosynthesis